MIDWGMLALWTLVGGAAGGVFGVWHALLRDRTCPDCGETFLGIKGKPTLWTKLGGKYICPGCHSEFKDPLKLGS